MFRPLSVDQIGGGQVMRRFTMGSEVMLMGRELDRSTLAAMSTPNRNALIENRFISVWPAGRGGGAPIERPVTQAVPALPGARRHMQASGFGRFTVYEGVVLGEKLTKDQAEKLCASGAPAASVQETAPVKKAKRKRRAGAPGSRLGRGMQALVGDVNSEAGVPGQASGEPSGPMPGDDQEKKE